MVEVVGCTTVVSIGVLELAKVVESSYLFWLELNEWTQLGDEHKGERRRRTL